MKDTEAEALRATLISALGRIVSVEEMRKALKLKQSTYYDQVKEGRLVSMENVMALAENLGINSVRLLVDCGLLERRAVEEYFDSSYGQYGGLGPMEIRREA